MTDTDSSLRRVRSRRRRWMAPITLLVLATLAWKTAEYFIQIDRYRPQVMQALADKTGLPVSIRELNLNILPLPCLRVYDIALGQDDFQARVAEIDAYVRLRDLLSGAIAVSTVDVCGAAITVPRRLQTLKDKCAVLLSKKTDEQPRRLDVRIGRVRMIDAALYSVGSPAPIAIINSDVQNPLAATTLVKTTARLTQVGDTARLSASLSLERSADGGHVSQIGGTVVLQGVQLADLTPGPNAPQANLEAHVQVTGKGLNDIAFALSGQVSPAVGQGEAVQALAGPFTAKAWWDHGKFIVNDLSWNAPGLVLSGDLTRSPEGEVACHVPHAVFNEASLAPLLALSPAEAVRLESERGAILDGTDLLFGLTPEGRFRFVQGAITFSGLAAKQSDGAPVLTDVEGGLHVKEDVVEVDRFIADGVSLGGTLRPDWTAGAVVLDLTGRMELTRNRLSPFVPLGKISRVDGQVNLKRIFATVIPGQGVPADLVIEGTLTDGAAVITTPGFEDTISGIAAEFVTHPEAIATRAHGASKRLGPIACEGDYRFADRVWQGTLTVDVPQLVSSLLKTDESRAKAAPILVLYGNAPVRLTCSLPKTAADGIVLTMARQGDPALEGSVAFIRATEEFVLGPIASSTTLPTKAFAHLLPPSSTTAGPVRITFARSEREQRFSVNADLTDASIGLGKYLEKKAGDAAGLEIHGEASPGMWVAQDLTVHLLGQESRALLQNDDVQFEHLDISLAALAGLLPSGAKASGRITGTIHTAPLNLNLTLEEAGLSLTPDLAIDSVSGAVTYADGRCAIRTLRILSANSDCTISGDQTSAGWRGTIRGPKLDVNALQAFAEEAKVFSRSAATPPAAEYRPNPLTGTCSVDLDQVYYRRARLEGVHADLELLNDVTHIRNIRARPFSGGITGAVDLAPARGEARAYVDIDLALDGIDARIIDDLSLKAPRGYSGTINGKVRLRAPYGPDIEPVNGMTGTVQVAGQNGSLGKMGFATKLLAVLRTTEIFRLRLPTLKDEGLVFDTLTCKVQLDQGLMTLEQVDLANSALLLNARGTVDFPRLQTDVRVRAQVLEAVSGLVQGVPVLGRAVEQVSKHGGIELLATGSPYDPTVRFEGTAASEAAGTAAEKVKDATKKGGEVVKDTIRDAASDALNRILGR